MNRAQRKQRLTTLGLVGALTLTTAAAGLLYARNIARRACAPISWNYVEFARGTRAPMELRVVRIRGAEYYVWLASSSPDAIMIRAGSGPPVYVFDTEGTLVGWSPTTGDGEYDVFLGEAWSVGERLTADDVRRRIGTRPRTAP